MARGPKPKPAVVKRQRGSSRRPIVDVAPMAPSALVGVKPPGWLTGAGLEIWLAKAPALEAAKLLTDVDASAFGRYCKNLARWVQMQGVLDESTTYAVVTASGTVYRPRPEFVIADRVERQLLAAEDRFGLNPAERQRIFAARATSAPGDLFAAEQRRPGDPATPAADPIEDGPAHGFLN